MSEETMSAGPAGNATEKEGGGGPGYSYSLEDLAWLVHLRTRGFAVVKSAASPKDVEAAKDLLWRDLEGASAMRRSDPTTWYNNKTPYQSTGIDATLAQTAGPWFIRGLERVQQAFSLIWDVPPDDLITSMDAVLLWRPWWDTQGKIESTEKNVPFADWPMPNTEGLHLDQNPFSKPQLDCVQGMVPLCPVTPAIGGLEVVPSSHTEESKASFKERHPSLNGRGDWCPLRNEEGPAVLLEAEPGDLILWDARTIHGGTWGPGLPVGAEGFIEPPLDLARMSVTVAMTPRALANEEVQRRRRAGFVAGECFNHCPHEAGTSTGTFQAKRKKGYAKFEPNQRQLAVL